MFYRGVAQLVEYWSPKPWVVGSSPSAPAKKQAEDFSSACFLRGRLTEPIARQKKERRKRRKESSEKFARGKLQGGGNEKLCAACLIVLPPLLYFFVGSGG